MSAPVRLAIVGYGKIARDQHDPALEASADFELTAVADPTAQHDRVPTLNSLAELLAEGPAIDAVALCQPPRFRFEAAAEAIEAGLHVLLEKPPGLTVGDVRCLESRANAQGVSLYCAWHSRKATAVERARQILERHPPQNIRIDWRENIRKWHPGQEWILATGGFGVFDPGINALSILTALVAEPIRVSECRLVIPSNREAPLAATVDMVTAAEIPIAANFDFLEPRDEVWTIRFECAAGVLDLERGGNRLVWQGDVFEGPDHEYPLLYQDFAAAIESGRSEVDVRPLEIIADACLIAARDPAPPFGF